MRRSVGLLLAVAWASSGMAQDPSVGTSILAGSVVIAGASVGLGYSVVSIPALGVERFTDGDGRFSLAGLPSGRVAVRAKHLGYMPLDTIIVLVAGETLQVTLRLEHVPAQLPPVQTTASACAYPGSEVVATNTRLATLFEQVKENAERHRLLTRTYPFEYHVERKVRRWEPDSGGRIVETDTLLRSSERTWRYRPGAMMSEQRNPPGRMGGRWITMVLPELGDFADDEFLRNHCFDYAGIEVVDGDSLVRVDFVPARSIRTPDISGSMYVQPVTFQIRRTTMMLVNPSPQVAELVSGQVVRTTFAEIAPGVPIFAQTSSTVTPSERVKLIIPESSLEQQRLIGVRFLRGRP